MDEKPNVKGVWYGKKIISFDKNNPQIGIFVRKTTDGKLSNEWNVL